jgi:peptidoglycan/LPS O-acetylase OafA/YrhL
VKAIPELDGVRAVAILAVLASHLGLLPGGWLGVDLFFVLSGFLITSLLIHEQRSAGGIDLRAFYVRRALRILPPLVLAVILAIAVWPASTSHQIANAVPAALLFYANFLGSDMGPLAHTWSLSIEEHFYLLWPVLFVAVKRRTTVVLVCVIGGVLLLRAALCAKGADPVFLYRFTFTRIDSLAIGCLAAFLYRADAKVSEWMSAAFFCGMLAAFALTQAHSTWLLMGGYTALSFVFAGFILSSIAAPKSSSIPFLLSSNVMRYIGKRSYGIYLYHWPVFIALEPFRQSGNAASFVFVVAIKIALTFLIAEASFRTVETLALSFRSRFRAVPNAIEYPRTSLYG